MSTRAPQSFAYGVYFASEGATLWALDLATRAERWRSPLYADVTWSSPAITSDGTLYIGSMDVDGNGGAFYAFRTEAQGLLSGAGSPRFHRGNANNGRRD